MKTTQSTLFPDVVQEVADARHAQGFKTKDEREFAKEQRRKSKDKGRKHLALAKAQPTGPACLRCKFWMKPFDPKDQYGACLKLVVASESAPAMGVTRGDVIERDVARNDYHVPYEHLRTGEAASCSAYTDVMERAA